MAAEGSRRVIFAALIGWIRKERPPAAIPRLEMSATTPPGET